MLNRWMSRLRLNPQTLRQQKWFALFGERLLAPALWQGGRRALCGAVAAGLFASWVPMPMHSLVAVLLALAFGFNLPLALLAVWFNNPITLPFMYLWAYRTGCLVLQRPPRALPPHLVPALAGARGGDPGATLPARQPAAGRPDRRQRRPAHPAAAQVERPA